MISRAQKRLQRNGTPVLLAGLCLLTAGAVRATAAEPEVAGRVAVVQGTSRAIGDEGSRALQCGAPVYRGERVETVKNSRVGILVDDAMAYLGAESALQLGRDGSFELREGRLRVVDSLPDHGPIQHLAALGARAQLNGNDVEAYIFDEKSGRYAILCEWETPLSVARAGEHQVAKPGQCVVAKPGEILYGARAHRDRLGPLSKGACGVASVPRQTLAERLTILPPVATPPPAFDPEPPGLGGPIPDPCDDPGSGCAGIVPPIAVAPPPPPPVTSGPDPMDGFTLDRLPNESITEEEILGFDE